MTVATGLHTDAPLGEIHIPYQWSYADAAARTGAGGFVAGDVGKFARQVDNDSIWMLTATTPTWSQVNGAGTIGGSSGSTDNAVIRADGTGGATVQSSLATIDDSGSVNIPTGQTYKINGSPHTHSGGGGATIYTNAYASPPTPNSGDLWFPSDGIDTLWYNGSAWLAVAPQFKQFVKPVIGDFTWTNQGSCTDTDFGGIELFHPAESSIHTHFFGKAVPTLTYTIDIVMRIRPGHANYHSVGVGWSDGTGFVIGVGADQGGSFQGYKFASITSGDSGAYTNWAGYTLIGADTGLIYAQLKEDSSNRYAYISIDGRNWDLAYQIGRTDFITATLVGMILHSEENTKSDVLQLLSWYEH